MEKKGEGRADIGTSLSEWRPRRGEGGGRWHAGTRDGRWRVQTNSQRIYKKHKVSVKFLPFGCPRNAFRPSCVSFFTEYVHKAVHSSRPLVLCSSRRPPPLQTIVLVRIKVYPLSSSSPLHSTTTPIPPFHCLHPSVAVAIAVIVIV